METLLFLLLNAVPLLSAYLLTRYYFASSRLIDSLLSFVILYYSQIILTVILLGSLHKLFLPDILVFNSIILLLVLAICKLTRVKAHDKYFIGKTERLKNFLDKNKAVVFCLSLLGAFALVKIFVNLVNPPAGWDDLNYHFTFAVEWLKHGNLLNPIIVSDYPAPTYYPLNGSFLFYWLMLPFTNVFLADLGQIPFFLICFLCVYSIGLKIGLSRRFALYSAILFTAMPNYFKQLQIAYVDVIVTGFFLLSLNFLLTLKKDLNIKNVILTAAPLGMLVGTKIIVIPHAAIIFAYFLLFAILQYKKLKLNRLLAFIALFSMIVILTGGFSYIRNYFMTNNPLYPLNVKIHGLTVFKGVLGGEFINNKDNVFSLTAFLFHEGVGSGFILFVIPGLILGLIALFRKSVLHKPDLFFLFALIPLLYLFYRFGVAVPNIRCLYPWFAVCAIAAFWGIQQISIPDKVVRYGLCVCVLASMAESAKRLDLAYSFALSIVVFILFLNLKRILSFLKKKPALFIILFCLTGIILLQYEYIDYSKNEFKRYKISQKRSGFWPEAIDAWIWLDQNTTGNNIAYVGRPVPFPLYGSKLKNNVFYVSVNETRPQLHAYKDSWY
ncbi:MAG: hypothetical protein NTY47_07035, partial [Candidatus Omnitrophica bacterium]|nr:hypothetical protein [Candidatus Omnitrophota bacterium]